MSKKIGLIDKYKENTFLHIFLLIAVAFLAFSPTLKMFFYSDDFGDIYLLARGEIIYGYPPSSIDVSHYIIEYLYPLFGLNPTGYYAVGIGVVTLTVLLLYFFACGLFKNRLLALVAGLIYATTPVGVSTVFSLLSFYTESGYLITLMLFILLCLLLLSFSRGKWFYFLIVAFLLNLFVGIHQRRGFFLFPILFFLDYFVNAKGYRPSVGTIIRQVPLFLIFVFSYANLPGLKEILGGHLIVSSSVDAGAKFDSLLKAIFLDYKPLVSLANILAGVPLIFFADNNIDLDVFKHRNLWTIIILLIAAIPVVLAFKIKKQLGMLMVFFLSWMYVSILGFYAFSSPGIAETTARTVTLASPAYGLFVALSGFVSYTTLKNKKIIAIKTLNKITVLIVAGVVIANFHATFSYLQKFNQERSKYAHTFFKDMKYLRPILPANSLIYIETPKNPQIKSRLYNIFKGNSFGAGGTIGIYYGLSYKELEMVVAFEDVMKYVGSDKNKIDRVFAFYYDENGSLSDITYVTRSDLNRTVGQLRVN